MICTESTVLSLESILEDRNSNLFKEFATYLHQSYCIENLAFWLATQEYYEECNNKQRQKELCDNMINLYIKPNSPQEINIPCDMRQSILDFYYRGNLHLHIFDDAAEAVLELMRVNSFLPWTTCSLNNTKQHKSWPSTQRKINNSPSSNSLSALTTSFSFTDKWNLIKLSKQPTSRKSCSSLDCMEDRLTLSMDSTRTTTIFSVPSVTATTTATNTSGTRYKSMLKRVKKSLLGNSNHQQQEIIDDNSSSDEFITPRSSFTATNDTLSTWTSWRKSQR